MFFANTEERIVDHSVSRAELHKTVPTVGAVGSRKLQVCSHRVICDAEAALRIEAQTLEKGRQMFPNRSVISKLSKIGKATMTS